MVDDSMYVDYDTVMIKYDTVAMILYSATVVVVVLLYNKTKTFYIKTSRRKSVCALPRYNIMINEFVDFLEVHVWI